jgi:hypothetical protein
MNLWRHLLVLEHVTLFLKNWNFQPPGVSNQLKNPMRTCRLRSSVKGFVIA